MNALDLAHGPRRSHGRAQAIFAAVVLLSAASFLGLDSGPSWASAKPTTTTTTLSLPQIAKKIAHSKVGKCASNSAKAVAILVSDAGNDAAMNGDSTALALRYGTESATYKAAIALLPAALQYTFKHGTKAEAKHLFRDAFNQCVALLVGPIATTPTSSPPAVTPTTSSIASPCTDATVKAALASGTTSGGQFTLPPDFEVASVHCIEPNAGVAIVSSADSSYRAYAVLYDNHDGTWGVMQVADSISALAGPVTVSAAKLSDLFPGFQAGA